MCHRAIIAIRTKSATLDSNNAMRITMTMKKSMKIMTAMTILGHLQARAVIQVVRVMTDLSMITIVATLHSFIPLLIIMLIIITMPIITAASDFSIHPLTNMDHFGILKTLRKTTDLLCNRHQLLHQCRVTTAIVTQQ